MGCGYSRLAEATGQAAASGCDRTLDTAGGTRAGMMTPLTTTAPASSASQLCLSDGVGRGLVVFCPPEDETAVTVARATDSSCREDCEPVVDGNHNDDSGRFHASAHEPSEDRPAVSVAVDQLFTPRHLGSTVSHSRRSTSSLTTFRGSCAPICAEFINGFGGESSDGDIVSIFPVMHETGKVDKEGSLSQCAVLFEGNQKHPDEEAGNDLTHCLGNNVSKQGLDGSMHMGRTWDRSVNQSLISAFHLHRSTAPDSFSLAADAPEANSVQQLRLCKFYGIY